MILRDVNVRSLCNVLKAAAGLLTSGKPGVHTLELDAAYGTVEVLGSTDTVAVAMANATADYRKHVTTCEADCGEKPTGLLRQLQFVVANGAVARVIRFQQPTEGMSSLPIMSVLDGDGNQLDTIVAA